MPLRRLEILATEAGGPEDIEGIFSFAAHYSAAGERGVLRERGRAGGAWLYLEALEFSD